MSTSHRVEQMFSESENGPLNIVFDINGLEIPEVSSSPVSASSLNENTNSKDDISFNSGSNQLTDDMKSRQQMI